MIHRLYLINFLLFLLPIHLAFTQGVAEPEFRNMSVADSGFIGHYYATGCEDAMGYMWFGNRTGIVRFDGEVLQSMNELLGLGNERHTMIRSIIKDRQNNLWISNPDALYHLNPSSMEYVRYSFLSDTAKVLDAPDMERIIEDRSGRIWAGGRYGLYLYHPESDTFENFRFKTKTHPGENGIVTITEDVTSNDVFWLGTNLHGIQRFDLSTKRFTEFLPSASGLFPEHSRWLNAIWSLYAAPDGWIWIYTADKNDLISFHPATNQWKAYPITAERQLRSNSIACGFDIFPVSDSLFIISNNTGIGEFNTITHTYHMYAMSPREGKGLLASFCRTIVPDRHGRLWFPQQFGISYTIKPVLEVSDTHPYGATIKSAFVVSNGRKVPFDYRGDSLRLFANERNLQLTFDVPNRQAGKSFQFCYRVRGQNAQWTCLADSNTFTLLKLKPGTTILEYGTRSSIDNPENTRLVTINAEAATWEKSWFRFTVAFGLVALLLIYYQNRIRYIRREAQLREKYTRQLSEVQLLALRSQMNPHFLFNTINSINHFILKSDREAASGYLGKFSRLMRQVLQNSQQDMLTLQQELEAIQLYVELEQLRYDHKFSFVLDIDSDIVTSEVLIPPLVIQPFLENAIWHGLAPRLKGGELYLGIRQESSSVFIVIRDNGIGRQNAKKHTSSSKISLGASLVQNRIEVISQLYRMEAKVETIDLYARDGNAAGTEIRIQLPLIRSAKDTVEASMSS